MKTALSFLFSLCFFCQNGIAQFTRQTDSLALVALYNSTDGANWTNKWDLSKPMNTWYGIGMDNNRVTSLILEDNNLVGTIPSLIGNLTNMTQLNLFYNQLNGSIPTEITNLTQLQRLMLKNNQLTGSIPSNIGNLANLQVFNLSSNQLIGSIPTSIGNLTKLIALSLSDNQLSGSIPPQIGNLRNLNSILLFNNKLTNAIPKEIGQLSNLSFLYLNDNQLTDSIPKEMGNLSNLRLLYLQNNRLSGSIPVELNQLQLLEDINLSNNKLYQAPSLTSIPLKRDTLGFPRKGMRFSSNQLSFDDILPNMPFATTTNFVYAPQDSIYKDTIFSKSRNETLVIDLGIDDTVSTNIYRWFKNGQLFSTITGQNKLPLSNLQFSDAGIYTCQVTNPNVPLLNLYSRKTTIQVKESCRYSDSLSLIDFYNATDGSNWTKKDNWLVSGKSIDTWFGVVLDGNGCVSELNLPANKLKSPLPANLGNFVNLKKLNLASNTLIGQIPTRISNLVNLQILDLSTNLFNNVLPPEIGNLLSLKELRLQRAGLVGSIPKEIGQLKNLEYLDLSWNFSLPSTIPAQIGQLTKLETFLLNKNNLTGSIPTEIGNLKSLKKADFGYNKLTGSIPLEIGQLKSLDTLFLNDNTLNGSIPKEIGQLQNLKILGLARNELEGLIPKEIGQLTQLLGLNISSNNLSGSIPSEIGDLTKMTYFYLNANQLEGAVPQRFTNLISLNLLNIDSNRLTSVPSLVGLPLIRGLNIQKNKLTFKDVLPNIGFSRTSFFNYAPQDSIYKDTVFSINKGSSLTLNLGIDDTVTTNVYKWYRNGVLFRETTTNQLSLENVQDSLTGIYTCIVTNTAVPNLGLYSRKITVKLNCIASQPSLSGLKQICLGNNTTFTVVSNTYSNYQWSTGNTTSSITLTPSVSQTIYVTVTDTKGCTAKDSVRVEVNTIPKAQDDIYTFLFGQENIKMTVIQNDNVVKLGKIDLVSQPLFGSINYIGNGLFDYTTTNSFKTDTFHYRVCDEICPQFCDTAKVTIKLPGSTSIGIRPDCSCEDETLKFGDISEYPELTVINRWGNTVFKAQPYRNDWNGVNQNNQPLPAATYYYVLRLEGKDGKVIKGDLTIIR